MSELGEKVRNRIVGHRKVLARDLVPHEENFREHSPTQKSALEGVLAEIGLARSLLGYVLPDGRVKLIDGHMRRETLPDEEVTVEILDVSEQEAKLLLATIDPLSSMAVTNQAMLGSLVGSIIPSSQELSALLSSLAGSAGSSIQSALPSAPSPVEVPVGGKSEREETGEKTQCHAMCPECGHRYMAKSPVPIAILDEPVTANF